jgi:hypothetical protein
MRNKKIVFKEKKCVHWGRVAFSCFVKMIMTRRGGRGGGGRKG